MSKIGSMRFTSINRLARDLAEQVARNEINFALPIQRGYVWDREKKSAFILNMFEGGPTFPIYVNKKNGVDYVIDGQQRLRTTTDFIKNKFSLSKLEPVEMENGQIEELLGRKFADLPQVLQNAVLQYSFDYNYGENLSDEQVRLIFIRLNSGKPLSATEMTRAQIESLPEVSKMAQHRVFKKILTAKAFEASQNDDLIMQIYILLFEEKVDLLAKKIRKILVVKKIGQQEQEMITKCLSYFEEILSMLETDKSYEARRAFTFLSKKTHIITFIYVIYQCIISGECDTALMVQWVKYFFAGRIDRTSVSEDYNDLLAGGTNKRILVDKRAQIMHENFLAYTIGSEKGVSI